jgi:coproporphyrinogen III oxidase-like Fe-S oxidoreductase
VRFSQVKHPKDYLDPAKRNMPSLIHVADNDLVFEFMLNALRLTQGVSTSLFTKHTGLSLQKIEPIMADARQRGLMLDDASRLCASEHGKRFLNDVMAMFLPS